MRGRGRCLSAGPWLLGTWRAAARVVNKWSADDRRERPAGQAGESLRPKARVVNLQQLRIRTLRTAGRAHQDRHWSVPATSRSPTFAAPDRRPRTTCRQPATTRALQRCIGVSRVRPRGAAGQWWNPDAPVTTRPEPADDRAATTDSRSRSSQSARSMVRPARHTMRSTARSSRSGGIV